MAMKTAVLKIHNPSRHKRAVIDYAFKQYSLAFADLLCIAKNELDIIENECKFGNKISVLNVAAYLSKKIERFKNFHIHGSLKESLFRDVAENLVSYFELSKQDEKTAYPMARRVKDVDEYYRSALENLKVCCGLEDENTYKTALLSITKGQYMPMSFCRPDGIVSQRNFGLLYDQERNRFYAALYLLSRDSRRKSQVCGSSVLKAIHPKDKILTPSDKETTFTLLPLAFGKWHEEKYLKFALQNPKAIRTAVLVKEQNEYFLHVTFEFPEVIRKTETFLGIDRGLNKFVVLSVVDQKGRRIYSEEFSGSEYEEFQDKMTRLLENEQKAGKTSFKKYTRVNDALMHVIANKIVEIADRFNSQVILEDLRNLSRGGFKSQTDNKKVNRFMNRKLGRNPYNKLKQILDYKLPVTGLPRPKLVPAHYTSQTCAICNHIARENHPNQAVFRCVRCGHRANADDNASINIARRGIWWKEGLVKKVNSDYTAIIENVMISTETYKELIKKLQYQLGALIN